MTTDQMVALMQELHAVKPADCHRAVREVWTHCPICKEHLPPPHQRPRTTPSNIRPGAA
jgi:hypothetical protein